jgi:hypothetical protein
MNTKPKYKRGDHITWKDPATGLILKGKVKRRVRRDLDYYCVAEEGFENNTCRVEGKWIIEEM